MKIILSAFTGFSLLIVVLPLSAQQKLMGFSMQGSRQQLQAEQQFDSYLNTQELDEWMKLLSARPHHLGSPYDKRNAEFIASRFREWGYETRIDTYYVLFPTPRLRKLEMTGPHSYKALLAEPPVKEDPTTNQLKEQLPPYNAYSADGDVSGQLVFVNYGLPADYEELHKMGIDVKGKIVIARYGHSWRGIKPKVAEEHGAIGCIIYSDPEDDGYYQGDVYPQGPFKNEYGVQRGSVMDMPEYPGDPLTPGRPATRQARRLDREEAPTIMKIPVIPISYHDAQPLLAALTGPVAPESWRGALPITYHAGPGKTTVHLQLQFNWDIKPVYNVIATLKGSVSPDQWIIRGNHHDAWVNGAADPVSGLVAELAEAKAVSRMVRSGWRPARTIMFCIWDGEEPGLLGSTEWVEDHGKELTEKAVAYVNTDNNGRGFLYAGGSHLLEKFFSQIAYAVKDPETGLSVAQRKIYHDMVANPRNKDTVFKLYALGSGSDYSPFIQHLGIASFNIAFGGEDEGGEYHSAYDSYHLYKKFKDPTLEYGIALAKVAGRTVLRLADAAVLPFELRHFDHTLETYRQEVMELADKEREEILRQNNFVRKNIYEAAADPTQTFVAPGIKPKEPYFDFSPLQNAMRELKETSDSFTIAINNINADTATASLEELNERLFKMSRHLLSEKGLPGRSWYRHYIYAPGYYTGYGVKTFPAVREAIEQHVYTQVNGQIKTLAGVLNNFCNYVTQTVIPAAHTNSH